MKNPKTIYTTDGVKVTLVDTSKETKKAIEKLSKEALGASARVIRKELKSNLPVHTKRFKNHIATWKFIDKETGQPTLHIGFFSWQKVKKRGKLPSHANPWWIEFGTGQRGDTYSPNKKRPSPHIIEPKKAKLLTDKRNVYGKHVLHEGQRASHLLRNTVQNNIGEIKKSQEKYLSKINDIMDVNNLLISDTPEEESD